MIRSAKRLEQVQTYYFASKLKEIAELNAAGHDIINLGIGSPDLTPPPAVSEILIAGLESPKAHQYQSYYGLPELRSAFAKFYDRYYKVHIDSNTEVLPLTGSKEGIMHISMSFLDEGDQVLVPNPGYPAYKMTTLLAGGQPLFYDLKESNGWLPDLTKISEQDLRSVKLMWVNYPHMPTGAKGSRKLFEELIEFGHRHEILICHDNPYSFILNDKPLSLLEIDGAKETALELCSLSKGHNMAGWRIGAVLAHQEYISTIIKFKSNMDSGMFKPMQLAAATALSSGDKWFRELNATYKKRRKIAWEIFDLIKADYDKESAGLFVWAKVNTKDANYWSDEILSKAKVFIAPGHIFGSNGDAYLRLSLCSSEEKLLNAKQRITKNLI